MRKIEYYVATSIDGFICGPNDDISGFIQKGNGVERYFEDLKSYDTVIMGRKTYEFGYNYGLVPGSLPYPHMKNYVFSNKLTLENKDENLFICKPDLKIIDQIKEENGTNIYLCGGGELAKWLLENEKIDLLKMKLNPFIQGDGTKLFNPIRKSFQLNLVNMETYERGLIIISYEIKYI